MLYKLKVGFIGSVALLTIIWSMGLAVFAPSITMAADCPVLSSGDLFKVPNNSAVYLVNANMQRMYFPHSTVFKSWYEDYLTVVEIPTTCVDNYPSPGVAPFGVNYRPGSKLIKVQISPSVYAVGSDNTKYKIGSEDVASALYGSDWASKVVDIADVFWPNYVHTGDQINEAVPHEGMLIKVAGGEVYKVQAGELYKVDGLVRESADAQTVSQAVFDSVSDSGAKVSANSLYTDPAQMPQVTPDQETPEETPEEVVVEAIGPIRLTSATGDSINPSFVWTGSNYGVVWSDARDGNKTEIYFAMIDKDGNKVTTDTRITNTPTLVSAYPDIVWNGSGFGIVYTEYDDVLSVNGSINFVRIDIAGAKIGDVVEITDVVVDSRPRIAWNGNGYGIIWRTPQNTTAKTYFSFVNADGSILTNQERVVSDPASEQTRIIWDGTYFGIVYRHSQEKLSIGDVLEYTVGTYLYRIDESGDSLKDKPTIITRKESMASVWTGTHYASIEDSNTFSVFTLNGNFLVENAKVADDVLSDSNIAFDDNKYGIVAQKSGLVNFVEMKDDGNINQALAPISDTVNTVSTTPQIEWSGSDYGVVWSDTKDNNDGGEIYFRAIASQ